MLCTQTRTENFLKIIIYNIDKRAPYGQQAIVRLEVEDPYGPVATPRPCRSSRSPSAAWRARSFVPSTAALLAPAGRARVAGQVIKSTTMPAKDLAVLAAQNRGIIFLGEFDKNTAVPKARLREYGTGSAWMTAFRETN